MAIQVTGSLSAEQESWGPVQSVGGQSGFLGFFFFLVHLIRERKCWSFYRSRDNLKYSVKQYHF